MNSMQVCVLAGNFCLSTLTKHSQFAFEADPDEFFASTAKEE